MAMHQKTWSMDQFFISNLNALIQVFVESDFNNDLDSMFKAVKNLEILICPKVKDTADEYKNITWIYENMQHIFVYDSKTGKTIGTNPENMNKVKQMLDKTYRNLLLKLEKEKIYTGDIVDPSKAMGSFHGS